MCGEEGGCGCVWVGVIVVGFCVCFFIYNTLCKLFS